MNKPRSIIWKNEWAQLLYKKHTVIETERVTDWQRDRETERYKDRKTEWERQRHREREWERKNMGKGE